MNKIIIVLTFTAAVMGRYLFIAPPAAECAYCSNLMCSRSGDCMDGCGCLKSSSLAPSGSCSLARE